ncbi:protein ILRUN-like isoform X1 [Tachypleus tridentatus]|uniref:protein ILRUN-like isoform X1 n=1 Tax=Tachypleus tridentatus TaxID=6853 RepID=UPI003FD2DC2D
MDVDNDLDNNLLQQFSCLNTTDRDVLISQLQKILGNQLNAAGCAFFLDMNNWNLQAAACSFFDIDAPVDKLPSMSFVRDVTIGEGEAVPPSTRFIKTWRIQNSGNEPWPPGCYLKFTSGHHLGFQDQAKVEPLQPTEAADVSIEMMSPDKPGIYQGQWRMSTATGQYFGEVIWVILTVAEGGILSLTQQMDAFCHLGQASWSVPIPTNPFSISSSQHPIDRESFPAHVDEHSVNSSSLASSPTKFMYSCSTSLPSSPVRTALLEAPTVPQLSSSLPSSHVHNRNENFPEDMII